MSYRIEITAASLEELADKALALGGRLSMVRTLAQVPAQVSVAETSSPVHDAVEPEPETVVEAQPEAPAADVPDFDAVVTPLVLKLVEVKGKPAAQEVLGRFGVVKASQLSSDKWAELVDAINDELAA